MIYNDLREFTGFLEDKKELVRIKTEVDPVLEVTEIADRISKKNGPAILFEKVKGSQIPLVMNIFGSYQRMSWALGVQDFVAINQRFASLLKVEHDLQLRQKLEVLKELYKLGTSKPKEVKRAPCQQEVKESNFSLFDYPILQCWPEDGGRFITLPLVITKDPETSKQNMGMYRMQVFDEKTTGMHWHTHHDGAVNYRKTAKLGKKMEVAVALGGDPITIFSATAPLPYGIEELFFAGFLRKKPVEVVKAKTVDLLVPAHAEIILEGYVETGEERKEGPFGDHTGYYSVAADYPVFHITCITQRKDPIYPATIVGKPPMEDCYMGKATERMFLPFIKMQLPEIVDINLPIEGVFHNCALISIKKSYPMHARKVMNAIWGLGQMMFTKFVFIFDEDVNIQKTSEAAWKAFNNVDPARDIMVVEGPLDVLDHSANMPIYGAKMGIDATKKWPEEGYQREWPEEIRMSDEIRNLVDKRWKEYGFE
ncbi:MAG: menaquinone biosynthesis decarboxylase [Nitrospirae bacterium RBG_13_39_12]|nr:MAG: menaquinone biosynthesis decarboxylase [Nitrospirae bacterium RBG_13_39_12]